MATTHATPPNGIDLAEELATFSEPWFFGGGRSGVLLNEGQGTPNTGDAETPTVRREI